MTNTEKELQYFRTIEKQDLIFEAKTGFEYFDKEDKYLYGGLHEGLHILGALSSEGKSTFVLQLADQIAQHGTPILFFATEQSLRELIAKSLSRETYIRYGSEKVCSCGKEYFIARDMNQILNNKRYKYYTDKEKRAIREAIDTYNGYCKNISIIDSNYVMKNTIEKRMSLDFIVSMTKQFIDTTKNKPVIIVDYIQNLRSSNPKLSDKQNVDDTVYGLKELSSLYGIPVFAISSFNRENYNEPVNMTSFKESGAIEYAADFLYALQQYGMDYINEDETIGTRRKRIYELRKNNDMRKENKLPIRMEFKCLKQRNGMKFSMVLDFVSAFNYFADVNDSGWRDINDRQLAFDFVDNGHDV